MIFNTKDYFGYEIIVSDKDIVCAHEIWELSDLSSTRPELPKSYWVA